LGVPLYGFNFQWMASWQPGRSPAPPDERALDFLAEHGFDFVRIPTDYRFWVKGHDYLHPDESAWDALDRYLEALRNRGIHMSLNLHRAPGYCINGNNLEKHNLWLDPVAQEGFEFTWRRLAERFRGVPGSRLSFDMVNEPPNLGEYGFTRDNHEAVIRRAVAAIREADPDRPIVVDGIAGGHLAIPELADLGATHSGRGYQPMAVSHFEAGWWVGSKGLPAPVYPGTLWDGRTWDRDAILAFYEPWREVERKGVTIHIGEFGCHNRTPNDVAMRWLRDLLSVYKEFGWGYSLWNFVGSFGIVEHGRPGATYEEMNGYRVDRELLELLKDSRV
jgi:aryl-phospho-beta-D-glucosidase BglC (GH1 family)